MAWPPPLPPSGRVNDTPAAGNHPNDHNLTADALALLAVRSVPTFASTADRDAQYGAPPNGALALTLDTGTTWQRIAGAWRPLHKPWAAYTNPLVSSGGGFTYVTDYARYVIAGGLCHAVASIQITAQGATPAEFRIQLPTAIAATQSGLGGLIGTYRMGGPSPQMVGAVHMTAAGYAILLYQDTLPTGPTKVAGPGMPLNWTANAQLQWQMFYEAA